MDLVACCPRTSFFMLVDHGVFLSQSIQLHLVFLFLSFFFSVKAGTDALVWDWALVCAVNSLLMDTDVVSFFLTKLL